MIFASAAYPKLAEDCLPGTTASGAATRIRCSATASGTGLGKFPGGAAGRIVSGQKLREILTPALLAA